MKLGGCTLVMGGAWLVLSACSGRYDVGFEPMGGSAGTAGASAIEPGGSASGGRANPSGGTSSAGPSLPGTGGTMSAGPGTPTPGPDSRCGFTPVAQGGVLAPAASSAEVATRVYAFLEAGEVPELDLPVVPSANWTATLAESILDAHFEDGSGAFGLALFLEDFLSLPPNDAFPVLGVFGTKLTAPDATLATLLSEPTGEPHRLGILTDPELLAQRPTITRRGVWMAQKLFCNFLPPPPDVPAPAPRQDEQSEREWLEHEQAQPACAACHRLINPGGYSLEFFDAAGNYSELDNGAAVDASGTVGQGSMSFESFDDLAPQLAQSCEVAQCFSNQLSTFAAARSPGLAFTEAEANQIANAFADADYSVRALVKAIVTNRAFFR